MELHLHSPNMPSWCGTQIKEKHRENFTFYLNLKGRDHLECLGINGRIILEWILGKYGSKAWTGFTFLRMGTSGRLL
jgi:hypothetical protein